MPLPRGQHEGRRTPLVSCVDIGPKFRVQAEQCGDVSRAARPMHCRAPASVARLYRGRQLTHKRPERVATVKSMAAGGAPVPPSQARRWSAARVHVATQCKANSEKRLWLIESSK